MPIADLTVSIDYELKIEVDRDQLQDLDKYFDEFQRNVQPIIELGIFDWLYELKKQALEDKLWKDRTGALRAAHIIVPIDEGYSLQVDARKTSGKDYNYAYALELGHLSHYAWLQPAVDDLESELKFYVENKLEEFIDGLERGRTWTKFRTKGNEEYTMVRHPAGAKDPVTGKSIGGTYSRKL